MSENVRYEVADHVARITIDRPEKMNAMTDEMYGAMSDAIRAADTDSNVRCVIVTGAGDRAFSAGHDLLEFAGGGEWRPWRPDRFDVGLECSKATIAAVNGYCLAGALELALFCDIRLASETAQFGCPEVKRAILHGYGALRLPAMIGMSDAMRLLLSGEFIDAAEALRIGLVSEWPRQGSSCRPPTSSPKASPPTARWRSA